MIRVVFDFHRTGWHAYGRVMFVESEDQALAAAQAFAGDDCTIDRLESRPAKPGEYERYLDLVRRREQWQKNVADGVPNPHGLL